jgi:hypothetical protein
MKVIAVAARTGARTSDIVKLLRLYPGVLVASFGDFLRKQNSGAVDLQEFGQNFLTQHGPKVMLEGALAGKRPREGQTLIIDGLRHDTVWSAVREQFPESKLFCADPSEDVLVASLMQDRDLPPQEARKRVTHPVELGVLNLCAKADYVTRGNDPSESEEIAMRGLVTMIDPSIIPEPIQERFSRSVLDQKVDRTRRRNFLKAQALAKGRQAIFGLLTEEGGCEEADDVAARLNVTEEEIHSRVQRGLILAVVKSESEAEFPIWQFIDGEVLNGLPQVLAALSEHNDLAKLRFFLSGNHLLGGDSPLGALREGRIEDVVKAAELYLVHGAA